MSIVVPAWPSGFGLKRDDYCVEAKALFARFTTAPSRKYKRAIDQLIRALKKAGVWTKLDALYVFAAANSQSAVLNWIANAYNATLVDSANVTFTAGVGFAGNGSSSYVDSNFDPTTASSPQFQRNSLTFGFWSNTAAVVASSAAGFLNTTGVTRTARFTGDVVNGRANQATATASAGGSCTDGTGLHLVIRSASSAVRVTQNGATLGSNATSSVAPVAGSLRFGSASASIFSTVQFRAGVIGAALSTTEDAAMYAALSAYFAAIA